MHNLISRFIDEYFNGSFFSANGSINAWQDGQVEREVGG